MGIRTKGLVLLRNGEKKIKEYFKIERLTSNWNFSILCDWYSTVVGMFELQPLWIYLSQAWTYFDILNGFKYQQLIQL